MNLYDESQYDNNGVKFRLDGKGTEFGMVHRGLGPGFLMFDIDRLSATVELGLELKRENEGWVEYRQYPGGIKFVALFEVKNAKTPYSLSALDSSNSCSMARNEIAKRLGCRLFVVYGTNGRAPFEFWEFDPFTDDYAMVGVLDYESGESQKAVSIFWRDVLGIKRFV